MSTESTHDVKKSESGHYSPITRVDGITAGERLLKRLADHSFLSMWSYSGIYRDQGRVGDKGDGKEVCDLIVVFENHIIIFSDKDCTFPDTPDADLNWSRWYKKAIRKSAEQVWGAERWLLSHQNKLFLDRLCTIPFPIDLPSPADAHVHRVVVAHSVAEQSVGAFGGSGSLMIVPSIIGEMHTLPQKEGGKPFAIGQIDPKRGYVHVFDDTSLPVVLRSLDTVRDFICYLEKKEELILSGKLAAAAGEEDLLAVYLQKVGINGEYDSLVPSRFKSFAIDEGFWEVFQQTPERLAQMEANEISYLWDELIEASSRHIFAGTSYYQSHPGIGNQERLFRYMAREPRTRRRLLARALSELVKKTPRSVRATRVVLPSHSDDPYYVFLLVPEMIDDSYEKYREARGALLESYCAITKLDFPEAERIIGIATESGRTVAGSEDFLLYDASNWTDEDQAKALETKTTFIAAGLLGERRRHEGIETDFPQTQPFAKTAPVASTMKGRQRNEPCPCGSGKKFKRCHGQS